MSRVVYVDNNATTRVAPEVIEAMMPYLTEYYGNPSSMHSFGGQVGDAVEKAREQVASLLGAQPTEIVFTSCGSESDNTAIRGSLLANKDKRHIITTHVEHPAVRSLCHSLGKQGYSVTELSVDSEGQLDLEELRQSIRTGTALISVMYANNETGVIFPVEEIGLIAKEYSIPFHCDAVQAVGKIPIDLMQLPIDFLAISGHKLHAPKGIGVLYIRRGSRLLPWLVGGHQERGRRGGTEAVPNIVAFGKACELAQQHIEEENIRVKAMRDRLEKGLLESTPDSRRNGIAENRLPNTSNISFEYIEGEAILLLLNEKGICASSGSACTSGSLEPSHVLRAMGVPYTAAHGSIRFSLSRYNTDEDIDCILKELPPIINRLREISPFGRTSQVPTPASY